MASLGSAIARSVSRMSGGRHATSRHSGAGSARASSRLSRSDSNDATLHGAVVLDPTWNKRLDSESAWERDDLDWDDSFMPMRRQSDAGLPEAPETLEIPSINQWDSTA